jgi:flagellar protein FlaF
MWSTLAIDCMGTANQLPKELRAQIVSLSIWVTKYSSEVMQKGAALDPLIDVNRTIMQGLRSTV